MPLFQLPEACVKLITQLKSKNLTFDGELLRPSTNIAQDKAQHYIKSTPFYLLALEYNLDHATEWIYSLKYETPTPNWHSIQFSKEFEHYHTIQSATSQASALAYAMSECERLRIVPDSVIVEKDETLSLLLLGNTLVSIKKVLFDKVLDVDVKRVKSALKGISWNDTTLKVASRFRKIHGLSNLTVNNMEDSFSARPIYLSANTLCTHLTFFIEKITNEKIKRAVAQEITASFYGFNDWHHFKASESKNGSKQHIPYYLAKVFEGETVSCINCYLGLPAALHGFGKYNQNSNEQAFEISSLLYFSANTKSTELCEMPLIDEPNIYYDDAISILKADDIKTNLLDYFGTDKDIKDRVATSNIRRGVKKDTHLFLDDWIFWLSSINSYPQVIGERFDKATENLIESISGSQYKTSIVYNKAKDQFWLSTDWDNKPTFELSGLSLAHLKELESVLLKKEFKCESLNN